MTPPATNIRTSPAPEATRSLPAPALTRVESPKQQETAPIATSSKAQGKQPVADFDQPADDPTTPPEDFTAHEFDEDADVAQTQITDFDDDEVEVLRCEQLSRRLPAGGLGHPVPVGTQRARERIQDLVFIVDEQNGAWRRHGGRSHSGNARCTMHRVD